MRGEEIDKIHMVHKEKEWGKKYFSMLKLSAVKPLPCGRMFSVKAEREGYEEWQERVELHLRSL